MRLQSKNINKVMVITLCYIEILLHLLFRILLLYIALYSAGNNINAGVN